MINLYFTIEKYTTIQSECMLYLLSPYVVYGISIFYYRLSNKLLKPLMPLLTGNRCLN